MNIVPVESFLQRLRGSTVLLLRLRSADQTLNLWHHSLEDADHVPIESEANRGCVYL